MCVSNGGDICCFTGKYYLVDSGYAVKKGYLGPYRNARYHLDEFRDSATPTGYEEQFNFCHSSLRNVIERAFGRLKGKWHILGLIPYFERVKQTKLIIACFALHNWELEHGEGRASQRIWQRDADYDAGAWVAANASDDMSDVRDWIAFGILAG